MVLADRETGIIFLTSQRTDPYQIVIQVIQRGGRIIRPSHKQRTLRFTKNVTQHERNGSIYPERGRLFMIISKTAPQSFIQIHVYFDHQDILNLFKSSPFYTVSEGQPEKEVAVLNLHFNV